jgi:4-carboxymuconolactone decarboxylase
MNLIALSIAVLGMAAIPATADEKKARLAPPDMQALTPAFADYTDDVLFGDVWKRAGLSPRDRSLVTVSALIAGGRMAQLTGHTNRALDNGVKPGEITAIITHLAFYSGWPNSVSAISVVKDVFDKRGIQSAALVPPSAEPLKIDPENESRRAAMVAQQVGPVVPALAEYTNSVLFNDLWRRPDLAPRDRSLATIAALIANDDAPQLPFHIGKGMDNGLTRDQVSEVITHLAFYAGWPKAMSAVPFAKAAFEERQKPAAASSGGADGQIEVMRSGSQLTTAGAADNFTGTVKVASRFQRDAPARVGGGIVTFEPGARTAWHTHPLGQTLIVVSGSGLVQREGGAAEIINSGDVVWIPPGAKHWHGASATSGMAHIAISESLEGKSVDWMEKVSDAQYGRAQARDGISPE